MSYLDHYYLIKPFIPRRFQFALRRVLVRRKLKEAAAVWPIDTKAGGAPPGWPGWPNKKRFALVLTHDVETAIGLKRIQPLSELEDELGFKSIFNIVGGDYPVEYRTIEYLQDRGFEVGVHGYSHQGNAFRSREVFEAQRDKINKLLKEWGAAGFRSPSMYHNLDWIGQLDIAYDMSTFDTDPFEPQPDGMRTIFPFWFQSNGNQGYVELPYTLPQDHTLFLLLKETSVDIWKEKLDWIVSCGGMALSLTHPDYMHMDQGPCCPAEYPIDYYRELLQYVKDRYEGLYWNCLPGEMACFWKEHIVTIKKNKG
jgi:peptidoglycan/xylan/chitin deacetylase (PgdA/CDA1 family)